MKTALALIALLLPAVCAQSAQTAASDPVAAAADFKGPPGWQRDSGSLGDDHFVAFTRGPLRLRVQILGGKGSRYAGTRQFLAGPEAKGGDGKTPSPALLKVDKRAFRVYSRTNSIGVGARGDGPYGGVRDTDEAFCLIPHGKRFFVVSLTRTLEVPPEEPLDLGPLKAFLSTFRPR